MGALLDRFAAEGVQIEAAGDGKLRASGQLTGTLRAAIRAHKPAILAELEAANGEFATNTRTRTRTATRTDSVVGPALWQSSPTTRSATSRS